MEEWETRDLGKVDFKSIPPRPIRQSQPIEYATNPVSSRGDKLGKVLWQGRQWAVTEDGLECRDGCYFIEKERIREDLKVAGYGGWPAQVTGKTWADSDDFCTAWLIALVFHGPEGKLVRAAIRLSWLPERDRP